MRKTFCDRCNDEITDYQQHKHFKVLKHIKTGVDIINGHIVQTKKGMEQTSGVEVSFDVCLSCYNEIMHKAYEIFKTPLATPKNK